MLTTLAVENYRSIRELVLPLGQLNVVTGANDSGKSSLYRALRLLADASRNGAVAALAREGGLPSTLWAGPAVFGRRVLAGEVAVEGTVRPSAVALRLGFASEEFGYVIDLGLPPKSQTAFNLDPEIKSESIWSGPVFRPAALLSERRGGSVRLRGEDGSWSGTRQLAPFDSMLSEVADLERAPEILTVRELIRSWRSYDEFRTDALAPARVAHVGTRTPVLSHDGWDLAAALQTIREIGDAEMLDSVVDRALPGSRIEIIDRAGRFELTLGQHGLLRPLGSTELSDGTMRYLLLVAALLSPRPPTLLVMNEPETSLHPDLLPALAELIFTASAGSQVVIVTHSQPLIASLADESRSRGMPVELVELTKEFGQTMVAGRDALDGPLWHWPKR